MVCIYVGFEELDSLRDVIVVFPFYELVYRTLTEGKIARKAIVPNDPDHVAECGFPALMERSSGFIIKRPAIL